VLAGLTVVSDRACPPAAADCTGPHYWETFAAVPLPADATTGRELSTLIEREDIAAVCSADHLAQRSRNPARTTGWRIQA
jgi:hypothetical protein